MSTVVIDASVAVKWVVDEPGTPEALLLRRHRLLAPDRLIAECANILWKKVRRKELSQSEGMVAARLLPAANVEIVPMRGLLESATRLAIAFNHPAYDCCCLALVGDRGCAFVTADAAFDRKLQITSFRLTVIVLCAIGPA